MKKIKILLILFVVSALLLSITACNKHNSSTDNSGNAGNPLASVEENVQPISPEELQRLMSPAFFLDPDGDGSISTNTLWLNAQSHPASIRRLSSIRASVGSGKKILFYTRLNNQWMNFTSDLRQMLLDMGYTVEVSNTDDPLPDLSTVDVLVIIGAIGTPFSSPNDRPMPFSDKTKIQNFVSSGKGFFFTGDWVNSELPKYNDIAGIFGVTMGLQYIDYIVTGRPPVTYYVPNWYAYIFDYINYYSTNPSQPILKKELLFGYSCFSNPTHDIFKDVNSVLVMGSSYVKPRVSALAALRTHPTTSRPRDYPIVPEGYPVVLANEYGSGRYVMSCDSNAFANDGFATSILAGTDNLQFAKNIFNWLAKVSAIEGDLKILNPHNNDVFDFGQSINFIGSQTGNITNIKWVSSIDGTFAADTLSVTKSNLSPGTHTITLQGIIGAPPASIRSGGGPLAQIRAAAVGDPVSASITIVIKESKPMVRILGLDFLSCSTSDNRNRLYDRKETFKTAPVGQKFLEPTQWAGTMNPTTGEATESFNWPVCYTRNNATSLSGPSKIKLAVKVDDFKATNNPGLIEVEASGTIYGASGFQQPFVFSTTSFNPTSWPFSFTIESTTTLPVVAGVFRLEINWLFKQGGQILSNQRSPKNGDLHTIFLTWETPILTGYYFQDEFRDKVAKTAQKVEVMPTFYLEIASYSCKFAEFSDSSSKESILSAVFDHTWALGNPSNVPQFTYIGLTAAPGDDRGLDRLLDLHSGWCEEYATFLKALIEIQGIDFWVNGSRIPKPDYDLGARLTIIDPDFPALGGVTQGGSGNFWNFSDHLYNGFLINSNVFDLSYNGKDSPEMAYINNIFDLENTATSPYTLITEDPFPSFLSGIHFK